MAPGTKRIALGGLALAVVAWIAIDLYLPDPLPPEPAPHSDEGLPPIPEKVVPEKVVPKEAVKCVPASAPATVTAIAPVTAVRPPNADACTTEP